MTDEEIADTIEARRRITTRRRELDRSREMLDAELRFLQAECTHPGLEMVRDMGDGYNGKCEICGKTWW